MNLTKKYNGKVHWAKVELPENNAEINELKEYYHKKFLLREFNIIRQYLDPNNILSSSFTSKIFDDN